MIRFLLSVLLFGALLSCDNASEKKRQASDALEFKIQNLSDEEYPDNPDIGFRAADYNSDWFTEGTIEISAEDAWNSELSFCTNTRDTITIEDLNLSEFIPTIPHQLKDDPYLSYIACINQEWNRNQVRFMSGEFRTSDDRIVRVDVARNCLNAYLWEVIVYVSEEGNTVPYAHGWFDFPHAQYAELFEFKNEEPFETYKAALENWIDPESKPIDLARLRSVLDSVPLSYADSSNAMYPLAGARKKKFKEIIFPETFATMKDLQTDSALFATFTPPGFYNRKDPRTTELGRFYTLSNAEVNRIESYLNGDTLHEIDLEFVHKDGAKSTTLVLGGLDFDEFPVLEPEAANQGWKTSMGIGNHTFYEDYTTHRATKAAENPYYGLLLDSEGKWLDSHKLGIDGPVFHFADSDRTELHVWLLSFERHALVGHYVLNFE